MLNGHLLPVLPDGSLGAATDVKNDAGKIGPTRATNAPPGSFAFSGQGPTRPELQRKEFEYFPDQIEGREEAIVSDMGATQDKVQDLWNAVWGQTK